MKLLRSSGIMIEPEVEGEAWDILVQHASAFLQVGNVTLTEWQDLLPVEREALIVASGVSFEEVEEEGSIVEDEDGMDEARAALVASVDKVEEMLRNDIANLKNEASR